MRGTFSNVKHFNGFSLRIKTRKKSVVFVFVFDMVKCN